MTIQPQNNNFNYLIDPTFTNVYRLFVLSFTRINAGDERDSFSDYYIPNVEIKDFKVLIDGKSFFNLPLKNEEETYEKINSFSHSSFKVSSINSLVSGNLPLTASKTTKTNFNLF